MRNVLSSTYPHNELMRRCLYLLYLSCNFCGGKQLRAR